MGIFLLSDVADSLWGLEDLAWNLAIEVVDWVGIGRLAKFEAWLKETMLTTVPSLTLRELSEENELDILFIKYLIDRNGLLAVQLDS